MDLLDDSGRLALSHFSSGELLLQLPHVDFLDRTMKKYCFDLHTESWIYASMNDFHKTHLLGFVACNQRCRFFASLDHEVKSGIEHAILLMTDKDRQQQVL